VPFCVATSSSPRRVAMSLQLVGLAALVGDRAFTSTLVARGKPAPDLFLYAAARMGADPARTLVIEDSLTGIRAGLAAGMTVWRFIGGSHLGPQTPPEPEDARPHRRLVSFAEFFRMAPSLSRQTA
jgi:beta-phosphoglucomutase-like phosphatase (HAD superfamily)